MPVNNAIRPPRSIATKMPLPASAVAAPKDAKSPVPTIIAAVSSTAVIFPRLRVPERADRDGVVVMPSSLGWSSELVPRILVQRVVDGELTAQARFVWNAERGKAFSDGAQSEPFRCNMFL